MKTVIIFCGAMFGVLGSSGVPTLAASSTTAGFTAHVRLEASFIANASKLAEANAESVAIKEFARSQQIEQAEVLDRLDGTSAQQVAIIQDENDALEMGRSAAISADVDMTRFAPPSGLLMPAAGLALAQLTAAKGEAFDALYKTTVRNVLSELAGCYAAYAKTGDNAALRATAVRELERVEAATSSL